MKTVELPSDHDLPGLAKTTVKSLAVVPDGIANKSEAESERNHQTRCRPSPDVIATGRWPKKEKRLS